jgi:hypothetical protein
VRSPLVRSRLLALVVVALAARLAAYLAPGWEMWATPATIAVSSVLAIALACAVVALWRGSPRRRAVGAALLLAGSALLLLDAAGVHVSLASPGPVPYELMMAVATGLAGAGVLLRRRAARWLAVGLGAAGALSSGLNLELWLAAGVVDPFGWALVVWTLGGLAVLVTLTGRDVAADDRLRAREEVWRSRAPLVGWTRAATITAIAACPMLLVYACMQQGAVPALAAPAIALAVYLALAAALAGHGKALGGLLLALAAPALLALSWATFVLRPTGTDLRTPAYYLLFWLPAAATGLAAGAALLAAALRRR